MRRLAKYTKDVRVCDDATFSAATGLAVNPGTTNLLVRVDDLGQMSQFLSSKRFGQFGPVYAIGNTLSFTYGGTPYTVTNVLPGDFKRIVRQAG